MPRPTETEHCVTLPDTRLFVVERGVGYPIVVLHGGPGLDHTSYGDYLDLLCDRHRLVLVDQRSQGRSDHAPESSWTLRQMAQDVVWLAEAMGLERYAVLGHSYGALVALQNAVDYPGAAAQTIVSSGIPSARYLEHVERNLQSFEPIELRERVTSSWAHEATAQTQEDVAALLWDQMPFAFADPCDPRIAELKQRSAGAVYAPDVLRHFATSAYGGIEVEDRLGQVTQPVLVLAGRHDRTCLVEAAEAMARGLRHAELVVFENSAHMTFVEENALYVAAVRDFLRRHPG